jgi:hypothetical protein
LEVVPRHLEAVNGLGAELEAETEGITNEGFNLGGNGLGFGFSIVECSSDWLWLVAIGVLIYETCRCLIYKSFSSEE